MAKKIQNKLFDGQIMHSVGLKRLESGEAMRIAALARQSLNEVFERARRATIYDGEITKAKRARFNALIKTSQDTIRDLSGRPFRALANSMKALAAYEITFQGELYRTAFAPLILQLNKPSPALLRTAPIIRPFQGSVLRTWQNKYSAGVIKNATRAIRRAFFQGEGQAGLRNRFLGARGHKSILKASARGAEAIARTALNHAANQARDMFQAENRLGGKYRYTAVLDGRTTLICSGRDGNLYGRGSRPEIPAHINCRSIYVQLMDQQAVIGERGTILSTKTRRKLNSEWRQTARMTGQPLSKVKNKWWAENAGTVPAKTNFNQWLRGQSAKFQDEYLGKSRGALFRKGGLDLDRFVNNRGRTLSLNELKKRDAGAFKIAGL